MLPVLLSLALLLAAVLAPAALRPTLETPAPEPPCTAYAGFGTSPRGHVGCATDAGPARDLAADERLVLGLPIDPNTASSRHLAFVPGLGRSVAEEVVRERTRGGPFRDLDDLLRVRGIGPRRLEQARAALSVTPLP
jgi:competence protein ComEA